MSALDLFVSLYAFAVLGYLGAAIFHSWFIRPSEKDFGPDDR